MGQKHVTPTVVGILVLLIFACDQSHQAEPSKMTVREVSITMDMNDTVIYNVGNIPSEGKVFISTQADHFVTSEINFIESQGLIYTYQPNGEFVGEDYVEITREESIGDGSNTMMTLFEISITVQ